MHTKQNAASQSRRLLAAMACVAMAGTFACSADVAPIAGTSALNPRADREAVATELLQRIRKLDARLDRGTNQWFSLTPETDSGLLAYRAVLSRQLNAVASIELPEPDEGNVAPYIYPTDIPSAKPVETWVVTGLNNNAVMETASHAGRGSVKVNGRDLPTSPYSGEGRNTNALDKTYPFNIVTAETDTVDVWSGSTHNAKYQGTALEAKTAGGHAVWRPAVRPPDEQDRPSTSGGSSPGGGNGDSEPPRCWDRYRSQDGGLTWDFQYTWCENLYLMAQANGEDEESTIPKYSKDRDPTLVILAVESLPANMRARVISNPGRSPAALVVVPRATVTASDLAEAFTVLHELRKHKNADTEFARADVTAPRRNVTLSAASARTYGAFIASFGKAPDVDVPRVGKGAAVEVYIPRWK